MRVKKRKRKSMNDYQKLKAIAEQIVEQNEATCLISGSIALKMNGVNIRREPIDIDIYLKYGEVFNKIEGMKIHQTETEEDYEAEYYERTGYIVDGIKVDVFTPMEKSHCIYATSNENDFTFASHVIIGLKAHHALGDSGSRYKHKDDIMHILLTN